jgi:hypothetical protein
VSKDSKKQKLVPFNMSWTDEEKEMARKIAENAGIATLAGALRYCVRQVYADGVKRAGGVDSVKTA